jgi:hypothetical protein
MVARIVLLFFALSAAQDAFGEYANCKRRLLATEEYPALEKAVLKATGIPPNSATIEACQHDVWLQTLRQPQKDGTEKWFLLDCIRLAKPGAEPWHCIQHAHSGFRADTYPGQLGVWVDKPDNMPLGTARSAVATAFKLLSEAGTAPNCDNPRDDAKPFATLRGDFVDGDGLLLLRKEPGGFSLGDGWIYAVFEQDGGPDAGARLKCWYEEEIVVTG